MMFLSIFQWQILYRGPRVIPHSTVLRYFPNKLTSYKSSCRFAQSPISLQKAYKFIFCWWGCSDGLDHRACHVRVVLQVPIRDVEESKCKLLFLSCRCRFRGGKGEQLCTTFLLEWMIHLQSLGLRMIPAIWLWKQTDLLTQFSSICIYGLCSLREVGCLRRLLDIVVDLLNLGHADMYC